MCDEERGQPDTGSRVPAGGLADEILRREIWQLFLDAARMLLTGHHELPVHGNQWLNSIDGPPKETSFPPEAQKLLRTIGRA